MRLELFHTDGNAALVALIGQLQHFHFDLLANREDVGRFVDAAPGDLADVEQRIDSTQVDERAVFHEAADGAGYGVSFFDLPVDSFASGALFVFDYDAAIDDYVFVSDIELDDAAANLLTD